MHTHTQENKIKKKKKGPETNVTYCNLGLLFFLLSADFLSLLQKVDNIPWFETKFATPHHQFWFQSLW
jgi:hypothetical protein